METRTVQTAFRLKPELLRRLKNKARHERKSLNAYVEETLERSLPESEEERLDFVFSNMENRANGGALGNREYIDLRLPGMRFTKEELAGDERLAYILGK